MENSSTSPRRGAHVIVSCRASRPACDLTVATEVSSVLERRGALKHPPVGLAVSDPVALGIAALFRSSTPSGQVLDRFCRNGSADSAELLEAARTEQGFASAEGHAALYCLIGWVHSRVHQHGT
jgi:hypothetical protein